MLKTCKIYLKKFEIGENMFFGLTEEQEMIVETVRSFVENEIYPHENLVENKGFVPPEISKEIKGFLPNVGKRVA